MKKALIILLLFGCSKPVVEPLGLVKHLISQDGSWSGNHYNLNFDVENEEIKNLSYEKAYGGVFEFTYTLLEDSLMFNVTFVPTGNNYYTHTTMTFEWMYQADVHLGIIKGTIYYDNGEVVPLYKNKQYIIIEKI